MRFAVSNAGDGIQVGEGSAVVESMAVLNEGDRISTGRDGEVVTFVNAGPMARCLAGGEL
jgi:hypothetical protein